MLRKAKREVAKTKNNIYTLRKKGIIRRGRGTELGRMCGRFG